MFRNKRPARKLPRTRDYNHPRSMEGGSRGGGWFICAEPKFSCAAARGICGLPVGCMPIKCSETIRAAAVETEFLTNLQCPYSGTHSENFQLWAFRKFNFIFPENKMDTPVLLGNAQVCKGAGLSKCGLIPQNAGLKKKRGFARKAPRRFAAIARPDFCPLFRARNILPSPSPPLPRSLPILQTPRRCGALFRGASIWKSVS